MNWHFWNKTIFRKLEMFFSTIMAVTLFFKANLVDGKILTDYEEINYFIEYGLINEIKDLYNKFFLALIVIGMLLFLVGWKRYSSKHRDGIWLNNIATGYLATVFLGYGLLTVLLLKVLSVDVICAFFISAFLYVILIIDVLYYKKNKDIMAEDKGLKRVIVSCVMAVAFCVGASVMFSAKYTDLYDTAYQEYKEHYINNDCAFLDGEFDYQDYILLQYVNYYNEDGKQFTIEELEEAINNFNDNSGSWYTLWYCIECIDNIDQRYTALSNQINYTDYGRSEEPHYGFYNHVKYKLRMDGILPWEASYEELEEACKYVYETHVNQVPRIELGDEEGEIIIGVNIPDSGNVDEVEMTWETEGYYAFTSDWYEVSEVGVANSKDAEPVQVLEEGKIYYTSIYYHFVIPYVGSDSQIVQLNVSGGTLLNSDDLNDEDPIDIWVMPGNAN